MGVGPCICGAVTRSGQRFAYCTRGCGARACSYNCGKLLSACSCAGAIDPRKVVGTMAWQGAADLAGTTQVSESNYGFDGVRIARVRKIASPV